MCRWSIPVVMVLVAVLPGESTAQQDRETFELSNLCRPIDLVVEDIDDDAAAIDLTMDQIQTLAESRLRAARLYDAEEGPYLYVRIGVMVHQGGGAYSVALAFKKLVHDPVSDRSGVATTWERGSYGISQNGGFILQALSGHVDRFILEYLRVNEDACER